ncbi:uncharacterized protein EDB91DRAFT_1171949 [Suillus paluster]|uniref:uncharacterized protein n=1 Tax=Suillus paluster TaxID=48578 RepID=UPI001B86E70C|nr:uncharacterized protein EDB91DRAFT_1171949 [Suillus paluster]KAG1723765.1 hypothetical protein EDB91DRAFT_1171949 [Suillus paluster]
MRFSFVLAVLAALTTSISASPIDSRSDADSNKKFCPTYCKWLDCCAGMHCTSEADIWFLAEFINVLASEQTALLEQWKYWDKENLKHSNT